MRGKIIKSIAGFYEVHTGDTVYRCRAKGLFRALKQKPLVGDDVEIDITDTVSVPPEGNVIRLYPRTNALIRPNVANVDQALLVFMRRCHNNEKPWLARIQNGEIVDKVTITDMGIDKDELYASDPDVMEKVISYAFTHYPSVNE